MCGRPRGDLHLAARAWPPVPVLWLLRGVGSALLVIWSLRSGTSGDVVSLQKHKSIPARCTKASLASSACSGPTGRCYCCHPSMCRLQLAPYSSPLKVKFNPDEPNLRSCDEFYPESITPASWG
jgi:hypothetical protein